MNTGSTSLARLLSPRAAKSGHRDVSEFTTADVNRLDALFAAHPPALHDVVLVEPGEPPRLLNRAGLEDHLAACGMHREAKGIRRTWAPAGHALLLVISDRHVSLRFWPIDVLEPFPPPACAALRTATTSHTRAEGTHSHGKR